MPKAKEKGDDEVLVFGVDWSGWLPTGDTIATSTWQVPTGLVNEADQASTTLATVKISGGTVGETYDVVNIITTTTSAETAERTIKIKIVEHKYK